MRRSACTPTVRSASSLRTGRTLWPTSRPTGRCCSCSTAGVRQYLRPLGLADGSRDDGLRRRRAPEVRQLRRGQEKPFRTCGRPRFGRCAVYDDGDRARRLHALKSAFFFGDLVVALGADIRSSDARIFRITTALDQTHLAGPVTRGGATETSGSLPWVHHDGRGYVSLDGAPIAVSTEIQEGKWDLIDPFYRDRTQRGPVFKCWFGHDPARTAAMPTLFCRAATRNGPNGLPGIPPCGYFGTMPDVRPSNTGKYAAPWFTGPENTASAGGRSRRRNRRSTSSAAAGPRSVASRPLNGAAD